MTKDGYLEQTEVHELALVYAHAKVFSCMQSNQHYSEEDMLNLLIRAYKNAVDLIPSEQKREIS